MSQDRSHLEARRIRRSNGVDAIQYFNPNEDEVAAERRSGSAVNMLNLAEFPPSHAGNTPEDQLSEEYRVVAGPALTAAATTNRPKENRVSRLCINCGYRVRAGEGRYAPPGGNGEFPVKHYGECPTGHPAAPEDSPVEERLMDGIERLTPEGGGPRMYGIEGHGAYPSVTTVLSGGGIPEDLTRWRMREAVEAGRMLSDMADEDSKEWMKRAMSAPDRVSAEAAAFGTAVHACCEDVVNARILGQIPDIEQIIQSHVRDDEHLRDGYVDRVARRVHGFLQWEQEWVDEWIGAEIVCWSNSEEYAGSGDAIAKVRPAVFDEGKSAWMPDREAEPVITGVDWKTSRPFTPHDQPTRVTSEKNMMQGAAYSTAEWFKSAIGDNTEGTQMPETGQALVVHLGMNETSTQGIPPEDIPKWKAAFNACREVAEVQRKLAQQISAI